MATEIIKTVKPSGGDYTSLSAWEAGEQGDLVTADEIRQAECYSMEDTTAVVISGWTTDATRYVRIYTPTSDRHDGEWNATKYRLTLTAADVLTIAQSSLNLKIEGLQFRINLNADWTYRKCIYNSYSTGNTVDIDRCVFYVNGNGGGKYGWGVSLYSAAGNIGTVKVQNCGFYSPGTAGESIGIKDGDSTAGSIYIYNNTFKNFTKGVDRLGTGTLYVKNCGFVSCITDINGTPTGTTTNSTTTPTFDSGKEFHLASGDTTWKDQGTDLSADGGSINSLDIDGASRSGTWDIGADEYVAVGGEAITVDKWFQKTAMQHNLKPEVVSY